MDSQFKPCSDGEVLPVSLPCPPPYSGPYYYYPYDNLPLPPEEGINTDYSVPSSSKGGSGASISSGAVAAIIITGGFTFFVLCLVALKCRARFILGYGRSNARNHDQLEGDQFLVSSGDNMVVNIVGCGLEERLVNLLPVYEYVGLMEGGKERQECAVCLSLFEEKETVRVLPKCHHVFHIHCIDKWFESHANCPLCRERITLQTIQLSLKYSTKPDHDQKPLDPAFTPPQSLAHDHDRSDQHSINDQHENSSSSRDFCVNVDHQRLAGDLQHPHSHQNASFALPSAALNINIPQSTKAADQPGATVHAACGHVAADDRNSAGFTHRAQDHCDDKDSIPAAIPAEFLQDAESKQDKNAFKQAVRDAIIAPLLYSNDDVQSGAGPPSAACGLQSFYKRLNPSAAARDRAHTGASAHQAHQNKADDHRSSQGKKESSYKAGECFQPVQQASAGDHKTAPTNFHVEQQTSHDFERPLLMINSNACASSSSTRQCSPLRKSLSTGSMDIEKTAPARLARSSTRLFL